MLSQPTHTPTQNFLCLFPFFFFLSCQGREGARSGVARRGAQALASNRSALTLRIADVLERKRRPKSSAPAPGGVHVPHDRPRTRPASGGCDCWYPICRVRVQQLHSTEFSAFAHIRPCSKNSIADGPTLAVRSRAPRTRRGRVAGMPHRLSTRPSHLCSTQ